ncbi:MAG: hypothetical protein KatS3mg113_0169 [Planctomycetaceae bacterium]|nr:MAG: hypothetical protein KatS3mg113_0169 [Planctomycetaceae bacterium]
MTPSSASASVDSAVSPGCPPPLRFAEVLRQWSAQAQTFTVPAQRGRLMVRQLGSGPALYFLNGFGAPSSWYVLTAWLLREQFKCVLMDWVGPRYPERLEDFAAAVLQIMPAVGDETACLYGMGFGGWVAVEAVQQAPELISALILQSVSPEWKLTPGERCFAWLGRWFTCPQGWIPGWRVVHTHNHRGWFPPLDLGRWSFFLSEAASLPCGFLAQQAWCSRHICYQRKLNYTRPVLILDTEGTDARCHDMQGCWQRIFPQAHYEWLHTTGLHPYITHPHRLARVIQQWWQSANGHVVSPTEIPKQEPKLS